MITSIEFIDNAHVSALNQALYNVVASNANGILILACDKDEWGPAQNNWLTSDDVKAYSLPIFGGVFPFVLYQGASFEHGTLIIGLTFRPEIHIAKNISASSDWSKALESYTVTYGHPYTQLIFVDGLAKNIERVSEQIYSLLGEAATTVGCGAGSLDFQQKPCIISSNGLLSDVVLIAAIDTKCGLGVNHGWEIFAGPFLVSRADKNCISTLNYQPALDIYQDTIETNSHYRFGDLPFFEVAKTFPFGISSIDGELLVRDPIATKETSLLCVGEVPQNSCVYLLKGKPESLIESAGEAVNTAIGSFSTNKDASVAIIFDCISRSLFLGDNFSQELEIIESRLPENCVSFGALTLGEICTSPSGPITLLNKSTVIAVL